MSESLAKKKRATIDLRNVNHPGKVTRVDADKYMAMIVIGGPLEDSNLQPKDHESRVPSGSEV